MEIAGMLSVLLVAISCKPEVSSTLQGTGQPPTVTVTEVERRLVPDEVGFVGRIAAKDRIDIRAQVAGILVKQHFEDGAMVKQGDLLFEVEPDDYEAALASAEAQVDSAEAERDRARQFLKRVQSVGSGGVSATDLEQAEIDLRTAEAVLDQAVSAHTRAELNLKRTKILAPIDGQIGKATVDAGNLVDATTGALATIVRTDPIRVQHALSERFLTASLQRLQDRDPKLPPIRDTLLPRITLSTGDRYQYEGRIVFLDNEVGASTGSIQAEAEFPNPHGLLKPGQFVDLSVQRGAPIERLLVPQSAVQQDREGHFLLVVDSEGNVSRRRITTGDRIGPEWSVETGISAGELVIVLGVEKVRPGAKVNAVQMNGQNLPGEPASLSPQSKTAADEHISDYEKTEV